MSSKPARIADSSARRQVPLAARRHFGIRVEMPDQSHYDKIAERYDEFVRTSFIHPVAIPCLVGLCGPLTGESVLDLACGQGVLARALARAGAAVTGVDISTRLLDIARRLETDEPLGITYVHDDATTLRRLRDGAFGGVAANCAFTDIDDLEDVLTATHRVLQPGGWFAFAALHPCFEPPHARGVEDDDGRAAKRVSRYFEEGPWQSKNPESLIGRRHHRTLSTTLNALIDAGFQVTRFAEPKGPSDILEQAPIYGEIAEVIVVTARRLP